MPSRRQPANLDAAAAGYFNDAVAVPTRGRAQSCECRKWDRADWQEPDEQSIARLHWRR